MFWLHPVALISIVSRHSRLFPTGELSNQLVISLANLATKEEKLWSYWKPDGIDTVWDVAVTNRRI